MKTTRSAVLPRGQVLRMSRDKRRAQGEKIYVTFDEISSEVIRIRFKQGQRDSVKRWVNIRYQTVWAYADWPWKRQGPVESGHRQRGTQPGPAAGLPAPGDGLR